MQSKQMMGMGMALLLGIVFSACAQRDQAVKTGTSSGEPEITAKETERPKGIADESGAKTIPPKGSAPTASPQNDSPTSTKSVPPKTTGISQDVPVISSMDGEGAIAQNFDTTDISGTIIPYLVDNRQQIGACQDIMYDAEFTQSASAAYRVSENGYLVHFVCGSSAYQPLQEYYLYERTTENPVVIPLPLTYFYTDLNGELVQTTERMMAGYSSYNPASQTISIFTKGRGLGDCGSLGYYRVEDTQLRLVRFLAKDACDGNYIEPENYPQVYP